MGKFFIFMALCASLSASNNESLAALKAGNQRYVDDKSNTPNRSVERRLETRQSQRPFAIILGCADSRVPPEIIFDQGIGDLFIVRVAGNCLGPLEKESILYSVLQLESRLIVVLGHENCGAVQAALNGQLVALPGLNDLITPAISGATNLHDAIEKNVIHVTQQMMAVPELADKLRSGELGVVGGIYDFKTGYVTFTS